jgi:hypothetical protein
LYGRQDRGSMAASAKLPLGALSPIMLGGTLTQR